MTNNTENKIYPSYNLLLAIAFLAGFVSLAYEIIATKVLYYFFNENTLTASSVISVFLFGLGLGGFIFSKLGKKILDKKKFLLVLQLFVALYAAFIFPNYDLVPSAFNFLYPLFGDSVKMMLVNKLIISFFYLILPTVLMGMVFPAIIVMSIDKIEQLPEKIGTIYALDLFGAVLGALISGFIFIPFFGIKTLIFFSVLINLLIGLFIFFQKNKMFIFMVFGFLIISFFFYLLIKPFESNLEIYSHRQIDEKYIPSDNLLFKDKIDSNYFQKVKIRKKVFFSNSPYGALSVFDEVFDKQQHRYLYIDTRIQCSTEGLKQKEVSEINFANISLDAIDKEDIKVLSIGLGCGFTLNAITKYAKVKTVDVVEINPLMPEAAKCFSEFTDNVLDNPKVNMIFNDGYKYLLNTENKYDLIIMDIDHPSLIYSSNLYTLEFYKLVKNALNKDGIFTQWSYRPLPDAQKINYNTLKIVFPKVFPKISGVFNDLYYIAGNKEINMNERDRNFFNQMLGIKDNRISTLNNPYFGTEMMIREIFKIN
ncbi:MAG: fused MFS/spermidine synthase [Deltaproteobacteria bacterium]|nr:fused MFS/spermidine synthase [Deltaproteobacteria bacterium]